MQDQPLLISSLIDFAAPNHHGDTEIVSRRVEGDMHRYTYADSAHAAPAAWPTRWMRLGLAFGDRVGTLAWNGYRHFELYLRRVSGSGRVVHTINPRLSIRTRSRGSPTMPSDQVLCFDMSFLPMVKAVWHASAARASQWIALCDADSAAGRHRHSEGLRQLRRLDRRHARHLRLAAAWTSARRRGAVLHQRHHRQSQGRAVQPPFDGAACLRSGALPDVMGAFGARLRSCRWCRCSTSTPGALPYGAALTGAKLVFPGAGAGRQVALRTDRGRAGDLCGRRAHGVARCCWGT